MTESCATVCKATATVVHKALTTNPLTTLANAILLPSTVHRATILTTFCGVVCSTVIRAAHGTIAGMRFSINACLSLTGVRWVFPTTGGGASACSSIAAVREVGTMIMGSIAVCATSVLAHLAMSGIAEHNHVSATAAIVR